MIFQKVDDRLPEPPVVAVFEDVVSIAGPCEGHRHDVAHVSGRAVGHQHDTIREIERLIDVVRDHDDDLPILLPRAEQRILQVEPRQRIQHGERLVEEQQLGFERQRARK